MLVQLKVNGKASADAPPNTLLVTAIRGHLPLRAETMPRRRVAA